MRIRFNNIEVARSHGSNVLVTIEDHQSGSVYDVNLPFNVARNLRDALGDLLPAPNANDATVIERRG